MNSVVYICCQFHCAAKCVIYLIVAIKVHFKYCIQFCNVSSVRIVWHLPEVFVPVVYHSCIAQLIVILLPFFQAGSSFALSLCWSSLVFVPSPFVIISQKASSGVTVSAINVLPYLMAVPYLFCLQCFLLSVAHL